MLSCVNKQLWTIRFYLQLFYSTSIQLEFTVGERRGFSQEERCYHCSAQQFHINSHLSLCWHLQLIVKEDFLVNSNAVAHCTFVTSCVDVLSVSDSEISGMHRSPLQRTHRTEEEGKEPCVMTRADSFDCPNSLLHLNNSNKYSLCSVEPTQQWIHCEGFSISLFSDAVAFISREFPLVDC